MRKIKVNLGERTYEIIISSKTYRGLGEQVKNLDVGKDAVIITNKKILGILGRDVSTVLKSQGFFMHFEIIPDTEKAKSFISLSRLIDRIFAYDKKRNIFLIALGGGVVGDVTGFIASIYKRGIPYIQIPTTLLAQVDSAIGGKTGIDLVYGKNLIGSFYQPSLVFSDISALGSLPPREIKNGLAEVVKYGVIKSKSLFRYLELIYSRAGKPNFASFDWEYIISECSRIKAKIVELDERDSRGIRIILNFGHTIGHALEAVSGYSSKYHHGEALSLGMLSASEVGRELGLTTDKTVKRIEGLVSSIGLPTKFSGIKLEEILSTIYYDKKFKGKQIRMVIPLDIGRVVLKEGIPLQLIRRVIKRRLV
jgi:3-dehydroquinate synthase